MTYEQYYEYIDFILASSGVGLALCLTAYAINYIRTLVVVRRLLEKEVEQISQAREAMEVELEAHQEARVAMEARLEEAAEAREAMEVELEEAAEAHADFELRQNVFNRFSDMSLSI